MRYLSVLKGCVFGAGALSWLSFPPFLRHVPIRVSGYPGSDCKHMGPGQCRKRAGSVPVDARKAHRTDDARPDPWRHLGPLGADATRTASALAELAVASQPYPMLWTAQDQVAEAVAHEMLVAIDKTWRNGVAHGKWLQQQRIEDARSDLGRVAQLQSKLYELELEHRVLEAKYDEARCQLSNSSDVESI